jgi:thiol:disulfide interchange protein DsbD
MKKLLLASMALFYTSLALSQVPKPVKWNYSVDSLNNKEAVLVLEADIETGWHIYSQHTPDGGPLPTVFTFDESGCYLLDGKPSEPVPHEEYDSLFQVKVLTLPGKPVFRQKVKINSLPCNITGRIDGQVCKEVCIMFDATFSILVAEQQRNGSIKSSNQ